MAEAIYVLRHAAPAPERQRRYWGRGDPGVDATSLAGVPGLATFFSGELLPERVLSSPLTRAVKTGEAILTRLPGLGLEIWEELAEVNFGRFDGLTFPEVEAAYPAEAAAWARLGDGFTFPEGEAIGGFLERARAGWERAVELPERTVLAVTHGGIISAWDGFFLARPLTERFSVTAEYAALTLYQREGGGWKCVWRNRVKDRQANRPA